MNHWNRRKVLRSLVGTSLVAGLGTSLGASLGTSMGKPGLFAEELERSAKRLKTASLTEGPFYPDRLPLDTDNDLLVINDSITPAIGEVTYLSGQVLSEAGTPVRNALVEIWQVDAKGVYLHTRSASSGNRDTNFQGYGRFLTDSKGRYSFRTVKPITYPGRTPHIHIAVSRNGHRVLTTQMLIAGEARNEGDSVFRRLQEPAQRATVLASFNPMPESTIGELTAKFDLILGVTPNEDA